MDEGRARGDDLRFRDYRQGDLRSCALLAKGAWPYRRSGFTIEEEVAAMTGYVESARIWSNWTEVAVSHDKVVGVLFARVDRDWNRLTSFRIVCGESIMILRALVDERTRRMLSPGMIYSLLMTDAKLALLRPQTDAEIELLIVDAENRGKGIGRALVERFFEMSRSRGCRTVTVYTDDKSSNWPFYERMGFRRVGSFYDNIASYYDNIHSNGIIYQYDL